MVRFENRINFSKSEFPCGYSGVGELYWFSVDCCVSAGSVESVEIDRACGVGGRYSDWLVEKNSNAYH